MRKISLDTNAYSSFLKGDEKVLTALSKAGTVYVSVIVLGELLAGFKGGTRFKWNRDLLQKFIEKPTVSVIDVTMETSEIFADIKNSLQKNGTPLPINDLWIAAHAVETGSVLITYDKHFNNIPGLRLWDA